MMKYMCKNCMELFNANGIIRARYFDGKYEYFCEPCFGTLQPLLKYQAQEPDRFLRYARLLAKSIEMELDTKEKGELEVIYGEIQRLVNAKR